MEFLLNEGGLGKSDITSKFVPFGADGVNVF
jgi:hypothetical protein